MREAKESTKPEKRLHETRSRSVQLETSERKSKSEGTYVTRPQETISKQMKIEGVNFFMRTVAGISAATSAGRGEREVVSSSFDGKGWGRSGLTGSVKDGDGGVELSSHESSGLGESSRGSVSDLRRKGRREGGTVEVNSPQSKFLSQRRIYTHVRPIQVGEEKYGTHLYSRIKSRRKETGKGRREDGRTDGGGREGRGGEEVSSSSTFAAP